MPYHDKVLGVPSQGKDSIIPAEEQMAGRDPWQDMFDEWDQFKHDLMLELEIGDSIKSLGGSNEV